MLCGEFVIADVTVQKIPSKRNFKKKVSNNFTFLFSRFVMPMYVWSETVEEKSLLRLDKHAGLSRLNRLGTKEARKMLKPYLGPYHVFMFLDFIMSNEFRFDVCSKWKQFELTSQTLGTSDKYLSHNNHRLIRNTHHLRAGHSHGEDANCHKT